MASLLAERWEGGADIDVLATGYGEYLVPSLAEWIRSGFKSLSPPPRGQVIQRGRTTVLYSGVFESSNLDDLATPAWSLSQRDHGRRYRMIYHESVRGCPYRCNFCNYTFLFGDNRFR